MIARKTLILAWALALAPWLADAAWAQRRNPNVQTTVHPQVQAMQVPAVVMPDLKCSIVAWEDKGPGNNPPSPVSIANGAHLVYPGGGGDCGTCFPKALLQVFVDNPGAAPTGAFDLSVSVKRNGQNLWSPFTSHIPQMPGGFGRIGLGELPVHYPDPSNQIVVQVKVDNGAAVAESNEGNNACRWSWTADIQS